MDSGQSAIRTLRGTPKHLSGTGQLDSFTYLMINLPYKCNFRCAKCFNLENGRPREYSNLITLEDRLNRIEDAADIGGKVVIFAGEGEPNLDKHIRTMVAYVHDHGMTSIIYSNGSTITDELIDFYKKNDVSIVFSFDTLDPLVFGMKTKAKEMFARVIINIAKTIESFKDNIYYEKGVRVLNVAVNATISDLNISDISKIKSLWEKDAYFVCNPVVKLGNAASDWGIFRGTDYYSDEFIRQTIQRYSESGGPLTLGSDGLCGYFRWGIAFGPAGDYITCAYTKDTDGLLGNIRDTGLKEAFEMKHEIESHFKPQNTPCLVRSLAFDQYLQHLREIRNNKIEEN